ncbi:MAG: hypothetical protein AB1757_06990 [Acidobacteriota bacterium]
MNRGTLSFGIKHHFQVILFASIIMAALGLAGCGGDSGTIKPSGTYEAGSKTEKDLQDLLTADARVENFDLSGDKLTVNVKPTFADAPIGLQQRALWNWYNTLQAARNGSKKVSVEATFEGKTVASWTGGEGFKPPAQAKKEGGEKAD